MSKNKDLKHRAICPVCGKAFDLRQGLKVTGYMMCADCGRRHPLATLKDYPSKRTLQK